MTPESRPDPRVDELRKLLRQAIPAVYGDTEDPKFVHRDAAALLAAIDANPDIALVTKVPDADLERRIADFNEQQRALAEARSSHSDVSAEKRDPMLAALAAFMDAGGRPDVKPVDGITHVDLPAPVNAAVRAAIEAEARSSHKHGDQDCDPSEAAAIAQWERDEGPLPHYLVGLDCWCHPYRDTAEPEVIIHREDARA